MQVDPAIMPATTSAISAGLVARDFSLPCGCAGSGQRTRPDSWASFLWRFLAPEACHVRCAR